MGGRLRGGEPVLRDGGTALGLGPRARLMSAWGGPPRRRDPTPIFIRAPTARRLVHSTKICWKVPCRAPGIWPAGRFNFTPFAGKQCAIKPQMRSVYYCVWLVVCLGWQLGGIVTADEFKLANGNILRGELASADEDGLVVKLDVGGFSKREPWINFSQETLKELTKDPKVASLVEPFIELEPEQIKAREKQKEIVVK